MIVLSLTTHTYIDCRKLDGVGLVDNRPSTDYLHHFGGGAPMHIHTSEVTGVTPVQPQQPGRIDNKIWRKRIT